MVATPMKKTNYIMAQFISRVTLSAIEAIILVLFTMWFFNIKIQGSILTILILFIAGNIAFAGIAMLVSSRTDNSQVANGLINLVVLPMMILSGVYFSYHNFPDFMVSFIKLLPLTILADSIRNVFLEGASLQEVLSSAMILTAIGFVFFIFGLRIFKWY